MPIVEFKLGLRGNATVPPRADEAWCGYIGRLIRAGSVSGANTPAFDCSKVRAGRSEAVVCRDPGQRIFCRPVLTGQPTTARMVGEENQ